MKKALAGLALASLLTMGSAPIALAQDSAQQDTVQQAQADTDNNDDGGKWGLLGLLGLVGLAGLAGLKRRDRHDYRTTTTATPTR